MGDLDHMDDLDPDVFRVRKRDNSPGKGMDRLVGYLVPMVICAVVAGAAAGFWWATGGPTRHGEIDRSAAVTGAGVKPVAFLGALVGAIVGAAIARKSELTGGRSLN
jgi:hypothetical protein